jgi:signal transduction histidine kinase
MKLYYLKGACSLATYISLIESGRMMLRREQVDLGEVVRDVVTELTPLANARKQRVDARVDGDQQIDADRDKLHQIAVNLLSNAIRYTPDGGHIELTLDTAPVDRYPGGWTRLRVRDNGVGIAEEDRQRIFDPFIHAQPAKHHTSTGPDSAGLGLYIAQQIAMAHQGQITVESSEVNGTRFDVTMPRRLAEYVRL